jgi:hypothetical protein
LIDRRRVLAGMTATAVWPFSRARAGAGAQSLNLMVAGPDGEQTSRWGDAAALALSAGFPGAPNILTQSAGGLDGVTGANRLDALVVPDGRTAAILPGAALIAWIAGDSRVHFDPTRWVPIMGGTNSGTLVVRLGGKPASVGALRGFAPLRLAAEAPQSADLAALIALDCLGVPAAPVFGLRGVDAKTRAFIADEVDAVFLCGEGVPEDIAPLSANGGVAMFCLGQTDVTGAVIDDPFLPGVPQLMAFGSEQASPLLPAYAAAAAAARMDFFAVLPRLSDPAAVAAWRLAAGGALQSQGLEAAARASSVLLQAAPGIAANLAALSLPPADQGLLQAFMTQHFGQQAG